MEQVSSLLRLLDALLCERRAARWTAQNVALLVGESSQIKMFAKQSFSLGIDGM